MPDQMVAAEIKTLLKRSLFLEPMLKQQIMLVPEAKQKSLLPLLRDIDAKQARVLVKLLQKDRHAVAGLKNTSQRAAVRKVNNAEAAEQLNELKTIEQELEHHLNAL